MIPLPKNVYLRRAAIIALTVPVAVIHILVSLVIAGADYAADITQAWAAPTE